MIAESVKAEFSNLEIHMGDFRETKFKMKCVVSYSDQLLIMNGGKRVATMHARNIGKVNLEKNGIRIAAMNFEIKEDQDVSVISGSIKLELDDAETWYRELWE
jgi:hypothetical protein